MKKVAFFLLLTALLSGCASLTYQTPDGTKVTYRRFMTGSDVIRGSIKDAKIEVRGQQVDTETLQKILNILAGEIK